MNTRFYDTVFFIALLSTAIALGGALAHAFELPNKIGLEQDVYFTVQQIYAGWDRLGWLLLVEAVSMAALAALSRAQPTVMWSAVAALAALAAAQAIFWIFTFPANAATDNWTAVPDDWEALRIQWEFSHLAGACCQLVAMVMLIFAALRRR